MAQSPAVEAAIQELLETYQDMADREKFLAPKREAAMRELSELVDELAGVSTIDDDTVTSDMVAAYLVFQEITAQKMAAGDPSAQMALAKFSDNFNRDFQFYLQTVQGDYEKAMEINHAVTELTKYMQPPQINRSIPTIEVAVSPPDNEHGEWTFAVVPVEIDENYKAKLVDTLDFDLYISMEVTPHKGLTEEFNIPAKFVKAGDKVEPFVLTHKTAADETQQTVLHVKGHAMKNGQYVQQLAFPPVTLTQRPPQTSMSMDELMRMVGSAGGPGPNGPN